MTWLACACLTAFWSASWAMRSTSRSRPGSAGGSFSIVSSISSPSRRPHQLDVLAERPGEPVQLEVERPELEDERAQLLERVLRQRLQPLDLVARRRRIAVEQRAGRLGAEDEAEQLLAHGVVEVEREAVPLGDDRELARLLLEARVRDRDRCVRGEQPDQLVVLVAEVGRARASR